MSDEPPFNSAEDMAALLVLVDADHRDHGIPDRSVPHDCSGFHYPCPAIDPPFITRTGKVLTDGEIQALADEAERGYDIEALKPRDRPTNNNQEEKHT